jgi:dolichyl-phosphate beta-glucosyltransferase
VTESTGPLLSIIIPAYKEGDEFGARLETLEAYLTAHHEGQTEVIVMMQSDDASGDREMAALEARKFHNIRIVNLGERAGKGGAVRAGMFEATGQYRLFMDADLATPLEHIGDALALIEQGYPVGIAIRDLVGTHKDFTRKFITKVGNILAQVILLPGISDTQCGFKYFSAEATETIFKRMTITGWGFDLEALALARKFHYQIGQIPAPDWKDPKAAGLVGDSASGAAVQVFKDLLRVRWKLITRQYEKETFHYEKTSS